MVTRLNIADAGFQNAFDALVSSKREASEDVSAVARDIIADVRARGDAALIELTTKFDRMELTAGNLLISAAQVDEAVTACDREALDALKLASERIETYHLRQVPEDNLFTDDVGVKLGHRWTPVQAAGLYVPGGTASYPSSVLMNAIPARVASVDRIVMTVPTPDGEINPLVLAAAKLAGVHEIYRIGGAQAIAALAYGSESIAPVDVIVGPGNAFVAAAKREVYGQVGIDMVAGPSEILVLADGNNAPDWIAADLLSQAEHDASSQSILITDDIEFGEAVIEAVEAQLATLPREDIARASWQDFGAVIVVSDLDQAVPLIDRLAPEHLELAVDDPQAFVQKVRNAGSIFLGRYTPEAIGDYVAGTNHVLPTARAARYASGLSVLNFMKRTSLIECDADSLRAIGGAAEVLAAREGLDAHGRSISIRLNRGQTKS